METTDYKDMAQKAETSPLFPETAPTSPARQPLRAEQIMGIIAGLSAALLLIMVVLCAPYFSPKPAVDDDPELALRQEGNRAPEPNHPVKPPAVLSPIIDTPDRNPYDRYDFQYNRHNYLLLQNLPSKAGVDVSYYQGEIDWEAVADSGIEFAFIRLGIRGYGSGKLKEDDFAKVNLEGASAAGLDVGAYFFSQALSIAEADEEIAFMLEILGDHPLQLPIVLDWEIPTADARTANMDARTLTDIQLHFCRVMEEKGLQPMIYFNWNQSENLYYLMELEGAPFWLALYQDRMTYPWKVEYWQYTDKGRVPGIQGYVDLNVFMPD